MYYAFYAQERNNVWKGQVELRGLAPGKYSVVNYEGGTELGSVDASQPKLDVAFTNHLLLEVSKMPQ
jgi:hypothetical protein